MDNAHKLQTLIIEPQAQCGIFPTRKAWNTYLSDTTRAQVKANREAQALAMKMMKERSGW